jgi:glycine/D-amino acid oxidase-like deaminating enzyme
MSRIVVLGAGVFGVTAALALQQRGHALTLVDPGPLPRPEAASTDVSKIVRLDYGADALSTELMERALPVWRAWNEQAGRTLFHEDGLLVLTRGALRPGSFEGDSFALLTRRGHALQPLDRATLAARFPAWSEGDFDGGYFNPQGGWAESGAVMSWLVQRARERGIAVHEGRTALAVDEGGVELSALSAGSAASVASARSAGPSLRITADRVLVAAGAWTPLLLPELAGLIEIVGQPVLLFRVEPAGRGQAERWRAPRFPPYTADVGRTGFYGFPALADGTLKLANHGAGRRVHPDAPRDVEAGDEARFREFLARALPGLGQPALVGSRLCLYDDTPDGHFLIDQHPGRHGLFVAAGGSGHAFKFAPVLGELIADVVEGRPPEWAARYAWAPRRVGRADIGDVPTADQARAGRGA